MNVFFDDVVVNHKSGPVLEITSYRAFGSEIATLSAKAFGKLANNYKYNGKELQSKEFSDGSAIEEYDYGARHYDPWLGRWMVVNPLSETSRRWSVYNYCYNNPMLFIDPDGMRPVNDAEQYQNEEEDNQKSENQQSALISQVNNALNSNNGSASVSADSQSDPDENEPYDYASHAYETADAAAARWLELYGEKFLNETSKEWSSVVYSFTSGGKEYYGYSKPVSWHDKDPKGNDAHGSSPGWSGKYQRYPTTFAFKIVGHIHSHMPVSGTPRNPKNEDFSGPDEFIHKTSKNMDFYLASPTHVLNVQRGRDVISFGITFESDFARLPLGQLVNGKFQPVPAFGGSMKPINTGAPRDNIYGSSIKKNK